MRHEALRRTVFDLLKSAAVRYGNEDLKFHRGINARLVSANALNSKGSFVRPLQEGGAQEGADTLVSSLFTPGDQVALDYTVINERAPTNVNRGLKEVEDAKVKMYQGMYSTISVSVRGIAMDLAGNLGPSLRELIARCDVLCGGVFPPWANWSNGSSYRAIWRQRFIVAIQAESATQAICKRERSRQVDRSRPRTSGAMVLSSGGRVT